MHTCGAFFFVRFGHWHHVEVQSKHSGHGTFIDQETVISSVAGTIERVNKLVSVRAIRTRYNPEVGDLIVGRITEVWCIRPSVGYMLQSSFEGPTTTVESGCKLSSGCRSDAFVH